MSGSSLCWVTSNCNLEHSPADPQNERIGSADKWLGSLSSVSQFEDLGG